MKLQKATRCALFAIIELAADPARQLSATDIAAKYGISVNHLAKVLRDLGRAGLVESVRGAGGGYRFSGNAKRATLYDVIDLFEDIRADSVQHPEPADATEIGQGLSLLFEEIDGLAQATLRSITIDTLLKLTQKRRRRAAEPAG